MLTLQTDNMTLEKLTVCKEIDYYWTIEDDGELLDLQCSSKEKALEWMEERFVEKCLDEGGWRNGDTREKDVVAIRYYYDEEGEAREVERSDEVVEFEYYHGDYEEHNTHWGLR